MRGEQPLPLPCAEGRSGSALGGGCPDSQGGLTGVAGMRVPAPSLGLARPQAAWGRSHARPALKDAGSEGHQPRSQHRSLQLSCSLLPGPR